MSTSQKKGNKILGVITKAGAESLLLDLANLPALPYPCEAEADGSCRRLFSRYPQVFGHIELQEAGFQFMSLRKRLRQAWDAPDRRHRDWHLFHLRANFHDWSTNVEFRRLHPFQHVETGLIENMENSARLGDVLDEPPPITPFEAAVFYLQTSIANLAKHCGGPECPAPYFIAAKRWQKYCSEKCAGPATRESKRRWWSENRAKNGGLS